MKFVRYGAPGTETPGVLDADGAIRDLSGVVADLEGAVFETLPEVDPETLPKVDGAPRLGPPVARPGKFVAVGLNYADHAAETGADTPTEPFVFLKATSSIIGPNDTIRMLRGSEKTDWEVELGFVIGKRAQYVSEADALGHVAGYMTVNDVSERHYQSERGGGITKGKSPDTYGPLGPWLVTPDEVPDPQVLAANLWVNGEQKQAGNTANMIFGVAQIIAYLSQMMTLHPGDVITTGTPAGVGWGLSPPQFLQPGDVVELEVEGLGRQRLTVTRDD